MFLLLEVMLVPLLLLLSVLVARKTVLSSLNVNVVILSYTVLVNVKRNVGLSTKSGVIVLLI